MKKIKLNTVKSKMVAGVAAVTLFSGVGFVAANTDAGGALQGWYNKAFTSTSATVVASATNYGLAQGSKLPSYFSGLKNNANNSINDSRDANKQTAKTNINSAADTHISKINTTEDELLRNMQSQFDAVYQAGIITLNAAGEEGRKAAFTDLKNSTEATGKKALDNLDTELSTETNKAKDRLKAEIEAAKKALNDELNKKGNKTIEDLKTAIDQKIADLKLLVEEERNRLVTVQEGLIADKALEMELAAKTELDKLVTGINN